ncbi:MAG: hypothetical protein ACTSYH_03520 [Candidatus Heimdallarchaeaceae archaeon]
MHNLFDFMIMFYGIETFIEVGSTKNIIISETDKTFLNYNFIKLDDEESEVVFSNITSETFGPVLYKFDLFKEKNLSFLLKKLEIVNKRELNYDYIIINNANEFFSEIKNVLNKKNRYIIALLSSKLNSKDIIISVPSSGKTKLCEWLVSCNERNYE